MDGVCQAVGLDVVDQRVSRLLLGEYGCVGVAAFLGEARGLPDGSESAGLFIDGRHGASSSVVSSRVTWLAWARCRAAMSL